MQNVYNFSYDGYHDQSVGGSGYYPGGGVVPYRGYNEARHL